MDYQIDSERYELDQIIAVGWQLFTTLFKDIAMIILVTYIPAAGGAQLLIGSISFDLYEVEFITSILDLAIGILLAIALAKLVEASLLGRPITWRQALAQACSRWGAGALTTIRASVNLIFLTLLFIVPGVIWSVYYLFSPYVVALRGLLGQEALAYSKALVKGEWWRVFGYSLIISLLFIVADIVSAFIVTLIFGPIASGFVANGIESIVYLTLYSLLQTLYIVFFINTDMVKNADSAVRVPDESVPLVQAAQE